MEYLITEDFNYILDKGSGALVLINEANTSSKIKGLKILEERAIFQLDGYTGGSIDVVGSGSSQPFSFVSSAIHAKVNGSKVLLNEDKAIGVIVQGMNTQIGSTYEVVNIKLLSKQQFVKGS